MTDITPQGLEALAERLTVKARMISLGEKIAWGSETALMHEAAAALAEAQDELTRLRELIRKSYHALNPDRPTGLLANRLLERVRHLLKAEVRIHFPGEVDRG